MRLSNIEGLLVEFDDVRIKIEELDTTENQEIEREVFETIYHSIVGNYRATCSVNNRVGTPYFNDSPP